MLTDGTYTRNEKTFFICDVEHTSCIIIPFDYKFDAGKKIGFEFPCQFYSNQMHEPFCMDYKRSNRMNEKRDVFNDFIIIQLTLH